LGVNGLGVNGGNQKAIIGAEWQAANRRVQTASKTLRLLIFATPPTVIGSSRYKTL